MILYDSLNDFLFTLHISFTSAGNLLGVKCSTAAREVEQSIGIKMHPCLASVCVTIESVVDHRLGRQLICHRESLDRWLPTNMHHSSVFF